VFLKEVAIALVVPPTSLLFLVMFGLLVGFRYRRIGQALAWAGALGLLVFALPQVSGALLVALEQDLPLMPPADQPPQAIVILGGDILRSGSSTPILRPGPLSLERELAGALLARRTGLPILVTGGKLHASDPPIAALMADSLEHDFLVPVEWVERESRDTWENARLSAAILREHGIRSVYLVTQAWHMPRALAAFHGTGITVTAAPTHFDHMPTMFATDFVPGAGSWRISYFAMHEWIGWLWYLIRPGDHPASSASSSGRSIAWYGSQHPIEVR
jgi:uncharacterized SAM-binding protein YcdF (DUF218 family)